MTSVPFPEIVRRSTDTALLALRDPTRIAPDRDRGKTISAGPAR